MIGQDREIEIAIGQENRAAFVFLLVQHLHLENIHVEGRELAGIFGANGQMFDLRHMILLALSFLRLLILFLAAHRLHDLKAVFGNIEKVAVDIRTAGLGIGSAIGTLLGQLVGIELLHPLDDLLAVLNLKPKWYKPLGEFCS